MSNISSEEVLLTHIIHLPRFIQAALTEAHPSLLTLTIQVALTEAPTQEAALSGQAPPM
ncbi:hypothetical protein D3C80_2143510 [compost metagenome]